MLRPATSLRTTGVPAWRALTAGIAMLVLTGCSASGSLFGGASRSGSSGRDGTQASELTAVDAGGLGVYLELMARLVEGDALTRTETFSKARDDAELAPTKTNRLRYALALSVPGHQGADAEAAGDRLRDLIGADDPLSPAEQMLARIQLQTVNQLEMLQSASDEFEARIESELTARDAEQAARLEAALADIERLQAELEDATTMLDAITNIEQSINERDDSEN